MILLRTYWRTTVALIGTVFVCALTMRAATATHPASAFDNGQVPLRFSDGYDTDGRDRGRPVVLIASALGVPADIFREAFTHVTPADPGQRPSENQVRKNKQALMQQLAPYGVTDDRLNEVSNYYRYNRSAGEMWKHTAAKGYAVLRDGTVQNIVVTEAGAGYSSPPRVTIDVLPETCLTATVSFAKQLTANGSIKAVTLTPATKPMTMN